MKIIKHTLPSDCDIALFGDDHEGAVNSVSEATDAIMDWVLAKKNRFFCHMGDAIEAITTSDKRYDHGSTKQPIPLKQADMVVSRYKRVAKRCLTWLYGNHEFALDKFGNLSERMAKDLGVPYGTWTTKLHLSDKHGHMMKFFLCHGVKNSLKSAAKDYDQRMANMQAALKMRLKEKCGDALLMACGHTHQLLVVPPAQKLILTDDGSQIHHHYMAQGHADAHGYIEPDRRWYANTGSFLRLYGDENTVGYGERAGFDPVELGHVVVEIRDRQLTNVRKVVWGT